MFYCFDSWRLLTDDLFDTGFMLVETCNKENKMFDNSSVSLRVSVKPWAW